MSIRVHQRVAPGVGVSGGPIAMLAFNVFQGIFNGIGSTVAGIFQAVETHNSDYFYDMETPEAPTLWQRQAERKELARRRLQGLRDGNNPYADLYR